MTGVKVDGTDNGREVIYIDPAYSIATVLERGQLNFFRSRDRGGYFDFVWGVHPFMGLLGDRWAGRIKRERFDDRQVILDGFVEGRRIARPLIPLNVGVALLRLIFMLLRLARRDQVKAIYATDIFASGLLGYVVSRLSGKPLLVANYGNQDENWEETGRLFSPRLLPWRRLEQWVSRLVLSAASLIEVPTENMRGYLLANGGNPSKMAMLSVSKFISDIHFEEPSRRRDPAELLASRGIPTTAPVYLLYVGRLATFKHTDDAVGAMIEVIRQEPAVVGLLAGAGPMEGELREQVERAELSQRIFFLGDRDQRTLASLATRSVTLSPLTGIALIETSLAGSPPVAYDRDWQPEFVADGRSGFIVPFRDVGAMAEKALLLVRDQDLRARLGRAARERALDFADRNRLSARDREAMRAVLERE